MRTILHIGRHKTGTSSLQRFLSDHSEKLSEAGYLYPKSGRQGIAHHKLAETYARKNVRTRPEEFEQIRSEIIANISAEKRAHHHTLIISSEAFQNASVSTVAADFPAESTQVVAYVREQYEYMVSAYQQKVHAQSENCTLAEFSSSFSINYESFFSDWERHYSREKIRVGIFSRPSLKDGDVIADFIESAAMTCPGVLEWQRPIDQNPSIGGPLLEMKRVINAVLSADQVPRKLYRWMSMIAGAERFLRDKPSLSVDEIIKYRDRYILSNQSFAQKYFPGRDSIFNISQAPESLAAYEVDDFCPALKITHARVPEMMDFLSELPGLMEEKTNLASSENLPSLIGQLDMFFKLPLGRIGKNRF